MDEEQEAIAAAGGWTMSEAAEQALDAVLEVFAERYGGAFFDDQGSLVALVKDLDRDEKSEVTTRLRLQSLGVSLATAPYAEAELHSFAEAIADNDDISAVSVDVKRSQVVLHVRRSFSGSDLAEVLGEVPSDAVRVEVGEVYMQW